MACLSAHDVTDALTCEHVCVLSRVPLFVTPWSVAHQAPLSLGFSRQEYRSGLPFLSPGDLPNPGIELRSPTLQADSLLQGSSQKKKSLNLTYPINLWVHGVPCSLAVGICSLKGWNRNVSSYRDAGKHPVQLFHVTEKD